MKDLLAFLTALAVLGIAQYLTAAAYVVLLIVLLMSATVRPRATFSFIASLGLLALALRAPAAMAAALGAIGVAGAVTGYMLRSRAPAARLRPTRHLLPPPRP